MLILAQVSRQQGIFTGFSKLHENERNSTLRCWNARYQKGWYSERYYAIYHGSSLEPRKPSSSYTLQSWQGNTAIHKSFVVGKSDSCSIELGVLLLFYALWLVGMSTTSLRSTEVMPSRRFGTVILSISKNTNWPIWVAYSPRSPYDTLALYSQVWGWRRILLAQLWVFNLGDYNTGLFECHRCSC